MAHHICLNLKPLLNHEGFLIILMLDYLFLEVVLLNLFLFIIINFKAINKFKLLKITLLKQINLYLKLNIINQKFILMF